MHKKKKSPLLIFISIILAIIVGSMMDKSTTLLGINVYGIFDLIGQLFINALMLVVVPLVSSSIITGIAKIGNDGSFGRLSTKIFSFYIGTSLIAVLIGLLMVNLINPGSSYTKNNSPMISEQAAIQVKEDIDQTKGEKVRSLILQIVPSNIVDAFHGQMLGLIFFSVLFGVALSKIEASPHAILVGFWQGIFQTMLHITHFIMKLLPLGVFCLVAKTFAVTGLESLQSLAYFTIAVVAGLLVFSLIGLPLLMRVMGVRSPYRHFRAMAPALITAFSTSSSSATLPITIDCVEKRAGVSNRICSLVIPLGTSINMSGSALYECVAAMFIAQVYGLELTFVTQFTMVFLALLTSIGVAGIPSASMIAILIILKVMGLPAEGIGLLFAVDRILDMCRTTVNVFSDSCCAVLVAITEGETNVLTRQTYAKYEY